MVRATGGYEGGCSTGEGLSRGSNESGGVSREADHKLARGMHSTSVEADAALQVSLAPPNMETDANEGSVLRRIALDVSRRERRRQERSGPP